MKIIQKNGVLPKKGLEKMGALGQQPSITNKRWLSPQDVAYFLGKTDQTILNWCKDGKMQAIPYLQGSRLSYRIPPEEAWRMKVLLEEKQKEKLFKETIKKKVINHHIELIDAWDKYCEQGLLGGRPYSPKTREVNRYHLEKFLAKHPEVSYATVKVELINTPVSQFAKREKIWSVSICFLRFLVAEGLGQQEEIDKIRTLKPRRHQPPVRHVLNEDQVNKLEEVCKTVYEKTLLLVLANTGLRASEFCNLKRENIDLEQKELHIVGKWGKFRRIGLNKKVIEVLEQYLDANPREPHEWMFLNDLGNQLDTNGIQMRLRRIGGRADIKVHAHALRRAFVTINANKGRPLVALQILCGHGDITTTRSYCQTSMDEAVAMSQDWNE